MKKKFLVDGQIYEIPEGEVSSFLKDFPNAQEARSYTVKGESYNIPLSEVDAFETEMGLKKKDVPVSLGKVGADVSGSGTKKTPSSTFLSASELTEAESPLWAAAFNTAADLKRRSIDLGGYLAVIQPELLPGGYEKTTEGVEKYLADAKTRLGDPDQKQSTAKELAKISETRMLIEDPSINRKTVSGNDISEISNLIGTPISQADEAALQAVKIKRKETLDAQRQAFENNTDNFRYDNKTGKKIFNKEFQPDVAQFDRFIEKIGGFLQKEVYSQGETANVLSADTRSDFNVFTSSTDANIKNIQSRFSTETLNNSFLTGLESLKYTDENQYNLYKKRLADGKTLASTVVAKLTNEGASIIQAKNLESLAANTIDITGYGEKQQKVQKEISDNFYSRPDLLQKEVASAIGEYRARQKGGWALLGEWSVTDKEIDATPVEVFEARGIDINRPEVKAAIQKIKDNEGVIPFDNAIPKDGLAREIFRGASQPVKGISNFFGNITASDNEKLVQSELEGVANYSAKRTEYFDKHYGLLADAFNGLGQFATQYLLMEAGIGLLKAGGQVAGGSKAVSLIRTPEAAEAVAVRQGSKVGNAIIDNSATVSQIAVPYLQSYDQYYKQALQQTDNTLAAKIYAFTNASMEAASEKFFDNVKFGRETLQNLRNGGFNPGRIAKMFDKGVFNEEMFRETLENGLKKAVNITSKALGGLAKESFEEVPVSMTNFVADAMVNPASVEGRDIFGEAKDAFLSGMVNFSIPTLLGIGGKFKQQFSSSETQSDALMVAAMNRNDVMDAINSQVEDGDIDQEIANKKIQILNTATATLAQMPSAYADGQQMEEGDRVKYLSLSVQEKLLKSEIGRETDEAVKSVNETKISNINEQKAAILNKNVPAEVPIPTVVEETEEQPVSFENDEELLTTIKELSGEGLQNQDLQFFIDQAASAPQALQESLTPEMVQGLLERSSDEELERGLNVARQVENNPNTAILQAEVERRGGLNISTPVEDVISIEDVLDKPAVRNGVAGRLYKDGQTVVFAEEGTNREYELGNAEEIKQQSIKDWGLEQVAPVATEQGVASTSVVSVSDAGDIQVRGSEYVNNYSNPLSAINTDQEGNIVSVNLETKDGKKRTFRGDVAEDIAYQIHLKELNKDNETAAEFEQFIETDEPSTQEILAAENESTTQAPAVGNNEEVQRQKIEPKPRIRVTAEQVKAGQNNSLKPKKTRRSNAISQQKTAGRVLGNEGVRGESELQTMEPGDGQAETSNQSQEEVTPSPVNIPSNEQGGKVKSFEERTDKEHAGYIRNKFLDEFTKKGVQEEQVQAAVALMEARAKASGMGDSWYRQIEDIGNGEFTSDHVLYQFVPRPLKKIARLTALMGLIWNLNAKVINKNIQYKNDKNTQQILNQLAYNRGIMFVDKQGEVVGPKEVPKLKDDSSNYLDSVWARAGYPRIKISRSPGRSRYNPLTNTVDVHLNMSSGGVIPMASDDKNVDGYQVSANLVLSEFAHAIQASKGELTVGRAVLDFIKSGFNYNKGYKVKGTIENDAHDVIEKQLMEGYLTAIKLQDEKAAKIAATPKEIKTITKFVEDYYSVNKEKAPQEVIDRAVNLWELYGKPTILPDSTAKNERAYTTATFGGNDLKIELGNITGFDDYIAEMAHAAQYVSGAELSVGQYKSAKDYDTYEYERKGSVEYDAHKLVEPLLANYVLFGKKGDDLLISTMNSFAPSMKDQVIPTANKYKIRFQNNQGAVETLANGRKVIHALEAPDFSTTVHELAHVFEDELVDTDRKVVQDWAGTKEWNTKTSEAFARGFERYLRDGNAPTPGLKTLFDKFKQWLTDIYQSLKGSPIAKKVSPEVKKIFDRLLTEQNENSKSEPNKQDKQGDKSSEEKSSVDEVIDEEGGGTVPPFEEEIADEEDESDLSGIRKALVSDEIVRGVDLERVSNRDMMAMGRKILDTGEVKPRVLVQSILKNRAGVLTPTEVVALITYKADLDNGLRKAYKEYNTRRDEGIEYGVLPVEIADLERQIDDFDVMAIITANQQSMAFRLRQNMLDRDYNVITQIDKYKKNNSGVIPPEVEAKFREYDKQLKELKGKISDLEKQSDDQTGQDAVDNIKESISREKKYTDEELEAKVKKGVQEEVSRIYEQLPANKKSLADRAIAALDKIQDNIRKNTYSDVTGISAIISAGITTIKNAIKIGVSVNRAVELGIAKIREKMAGKKWNEDQFRKDMVEGFEAEGVKVKGKPVDTFSINEDGTVSVPNQMIRDMVERGITDINDLTDEVHGLVSEQLPDVTKRQIRDFITDYGKTVNPTSDEIQKQVNTAKRVGRLLSELEDLKSIKNPGYALKYKQNPSTQNRSEKEKELKIKVNSLMRDLFGKRHRTEEQKLSDSKSRVKARIEELNRMIKNKDFAKKIKIPPPQDTELVKLNTEKEKLQEKFEIEQYKVELKNRSWGRKLEDIALELTSGLIRGLVASLDVSAVLVQGLWRTFSNPIRSAKAMGTMFSHMTSQKRSDDYMEKLQSSPIFPLLKASKLAVGQDKGGKISAKEGFFISNWINHIWDYVVAPVLGTVASPATMIDFRKGTSMFRGISLKKAIQVSRDINPYKASQRAFDGYTNAIRVSSFINMAKYLGDKGYTFEADPKVFQKAADFVNTTTGRGSLGQADASSKWLNIFFFAPRKVISELKLYTPYALIYYANMPKVIRNRNILNFGRFAATFLATNGLLHAFLKGESDDDDDQFWNPTSSNFLTHKIGDTKIGIGGGAKTTLVFMERMWRGYYTNKYGKKVVYGSKYGVKTRLQEAFSFVTGKAAPAAALVRDKLDERKGFEKDEEEYLRSVVVPMWMQDIDDLYKTNPTEAAAIYTIFSLFGANVRVDK